MAGGLWIDLSEIDSWVIFKILVREYDLNLS